ncbi:XRE family transcriptional regulator [Amycolatopsis sp. NPDC004079]|uniref:XRE family transcriptional regulator n=1 Tax=Amycolatopsis sp. NPDC004079 TaxID=3154549 RepID=UPI0033B8AFB7
MTAADRPQRSLSRRAGSLSRLTDELELLYWLFLGDELRKLRERRGWTLLDLRSRVCGEVSEQTLGCYELALRRFYVVRLVDLCVAMDESPPDLLSRVHARLTAEGTGGVRVRLLPLAEARDRQLAPAARWAGAGLRQGSPPAVVRLGPAALRLLAERCGLLPAGFVARLQTLSALGD